MFIDFIEKGRGGERKGREEREILISRLLSTRRQGIKPAIQVCALNRRQTRHLLVCGTLLPVTEPPGQGGSPSSHTPS